MGGLQEPLSRVAATAFVVSSAQRLTNGMLNAGEKPAVISAIMKYQVCMYVFSADFEFLRVMCGCAIFI